MGGGDGWWWGAGVFGMVGEGIRVGVERLTYCCVAFLPKIHRYVCSRNGAYGISVEIKTIRIWALRGSVVTFLRTIFKTTNYQRSSVFHWRMVAFIFQTSNNFDVHGSRGFQTSQLGFKAL